MTPARGLLLFLRDMLAVELETRGAPRVFVSFEQTLSDWRSVAERISEGLDITWPSLTHRTTVEVERFLSPKQRHHVATGEDLEARAEVVGLGEVDLLDPRAGGRIRDPSPTGRGSTRSARSSRRPTSPSARSWPRPSSTAQASRSSSEASVRPRRLGEHDPGAERPRDSPSGSRGSGSTQLESLAELAHHAGRLRSLGAAARRLLRRPTEPAGARPAAVAGPSGGAERRSRRGNPAASSAPSPSGSARGRRDPRRRPSRAAPAPTARTSRAEPDRLDPASGGVAQLADHPARCATSAPSSGGSCAAR